MKAENLLNHTVRLNFDSVHKAASFLINEAIKQTGDRPTHVILSKEARLRLNFECSWSKKEIVSVTEFDGLEVIEVHAPEDFISVGYSPKALQERQDRIDYANERID